MAPSFLLLQLACLEGELDDVNLVEILFTCHVLSLNCRCNFLSFLLFNLTCTILFYLKTVLLSNGIVDHTCWSQHFPCLASWWG